VKLLADENFRGAIVRGLLRRRPDLDLVRVPDVELGEADDPTILAWAATERRLVLTHDVRPWSALHVSVSRLAKRCLASSKCAEIWRLGS
jgi:predicted nuclease of predicted toxin-antitoxin system